MPEARDGDTTETSFGRHGQTRFHPEVRAAWIGAIIGSLVSAILSSIVNFVLVNDQLSTQTQLLREQVSADDQRATSLFVLEQRKSVYVAAVQAFNDYLTARDFGPAPILQTPAQERTERAEELLDAANRLYDSVEAIRLIGSTPTVDQAYSLAGKTLTQYSYLNAVLRGGEEDEELAGRIDKELGEAYVAFVSQIRKDLGVE